MSFSQTPQRVLNKESSNINNPSERATALYNTGVDYFNKKEYPLAIKSYKQAIAVDTNYVDAYNNLGLTFYENGLPDSAEYYLQISLKKYPDGTTALQNIGLVYESKGQEEKALECYKKICTLNPQSPEGFYNTARVLTAGAKFDEALKQALVAEGLYVKANSPYISDCHYVLLVIYYNMHNKAMADKYLAICKKEGAQIDAQIEAGLKQ